MKLIIAGTRPPEKVRKNVLRYTEWMFKLWDMVVYESHHEDGDMDTLLCHGKDGRESLMLDGTVYLETQHRIKEIVSGLAFGPDHLGIIIADKFGIPPKKFKPEWFPDGVYDKGAGMKRNIEMANYADALYLVWDGKSSGSAHMKAEMERRKKKVYELVIEDWTLGLKL